MSAEMKEKVDLAATVGAMVVTLAAGVAVYIMSVFMFG